MIRNRFTRFRNLQNLHVIPTASNILLNTEPTPTESELPPVAAVPDISNKNVEEKMFNQNKPKNKFIKGRKSRNRRKKQIKHFAASQNQMENSSYHWYNPSYVNQAICSQPPSENIEEVESTPDVPIEEDFEEVEVASVDADGRQEILVGFRASKLQYLNYKKNYFFKPKIYKFGSQRTLVNCLNVQDNCSVDVDVVSEAEYEIEYETENLDHGESQDQEIKTNKVNMKSIRGDQNSTSNQKESPLLERNQMLENNNIEESSQRIYKTCIEDNADISQGQCLIQSSLDTWKSHLIGLEYFIEIRDKSKTKYYCVLCSEDLQFEDFPAVNVINHINGCKHVVRYLEKHFPSYGFKFDENCDYNVVALQKICEEINEKLGYSSMCITNLDYYEKNKLKIKNIVQNASHFNDESLKLEKNTFQKAVVLDSLKDVQDVVDSIVEKILVSEEKTVISESESIKSIPIKSGKEVSHKASSKLQTDSLDKADKTSVHKESVSKYNSKSSKSFLKYRGNCALSSYLKIKYAKARFKGSKPLKGLSSITKGLSTENDSRKKKLIDYGTSNFQSMKSGEAVSDLINPSASQQVLGNKEKVLQKPTVHSKHCRKSKY